VRARESTRSILIGDSVAMRYCQTRYELLFGNTNRQARQHRPDVGSAEDSLQDSAT